MINFKKAASGSFKTTRAAMFGLDARIALAIFGALSVISGAALYSAIQQSKVTQVIVQHKEIEKALEAFLLDTGTDLPVSGIGIAAHAANLVEDTDSIAGWNGPYISGTANGNYEIKGIPVGLWKHSFIKKARDGVSWSDPDNVANLCNSSGDCFYWIETNCYEKSMVEQIDVQIDGAVDDDAGQLRYTLCSNPATQYKMYYKSLRTLAQ
jgi:type II secretory pathway pseudopilin PulG